MSPPLVSRHCDPELCSIEKRFNWEDGPFHGPSYTIESQWGKFSTLLPPRVQLLPHFEVWSYRAWQPLQMWKFTFLWNPLSELRGVKSFSQCKVNGATLGRSCPPGVQLLPHFEYGFRACQPLEMWQISHFCEIHSLSYEASKFFSMLVYAFFFAPILPLGQTSYPRSLIKVIAHIPD